MNVTFAPKGVVEFEDAKIIYRNFSGAESQYNRKGDRNFAIVIDDEKVKDELAKEGYNVKVKPPREEGDIPFMYLAVKVKPNEYGPFVNIITKGKKNQLWPQQDADCDEDIIGTLDQIEIDAIDLSIRPYDWNVNGKSGTAAYLKSIYVVQHVDRLMEKYLNDEPEDDCPF